MASSLKATRRTFVKALGSISALGTLAPLSLGAFQPYLASASIRQFAIVASATHVIKVFSVSENGSWEHVQTVPSLSPTSLVLSPDQRFLYAANGVDSFAHRPTGSVEAFAIERQTGQLTRLNQQALALFSTLPTHLAVSPSGRWLASAASGGCNLLPIRADGFIGRLTAVTRSLNAKALNKDLDNLIQPELKFKSEEVLEFTDAFRERILSYRVTPQGALSLEGDCSTFLSVPSYQPSPSDVNGTTHVGINHAQPAKFSEVSLVPAPTAIAIVHL
ncbi:lactonase family protein [Granulicella arctica]|uniref:lactonase family protein n=1 Tax=Granulicella arctica TaxID=940613 RepID=UPI0021E0632D|nr:lactonase family protein [Granulicella arctica]